MFDSHTMTYQPTDNNYRAFKSTNVASYKRKPTKKEFLEVWAMVCEDYPSYCQTWNKGGQNRGRDLAACYFNAMHNPSTSSEYCRRGFIREGLDPAKFEKRYKTLRSMCDPSIITHW